MNQNVLNAYEKAARIYCAKSGIDPETPHPDPDGGLILGARKMRPHWHFVAIELHDLSLRLVAMKQAHEGPKDKGRIQLQ